MWTNLLVTLAYRKRETKQRRKVVSLLYSSYFGKFGRLDARSLVFFVVCVSSVLALWCWGIRVPCVSVSVWRGLACLLACL